MRHLTFITALLLTLLLFNGCSNGSDGSNGSNGADGISITWLGSAASDPQDPSYNDAYHNTTDGVSYIWDGDSWKILVKNGTDGADGTNGISVNWLGDAATAPVDPSLNDGYHNITDGISYIWDGSAWKVLAKDGVDGTNGTNGTDGTNGISVNWLGDATTAPGNPSLNDGYHNTSDAISYIWDGNIWKILVKDGTNGTDGIDGSNGTNGTNGISVNWKGDLSSAPTSPSLNDAYYNTTEKIAYIYDGSVWKILAKDGTNGTDGTDGTNGTNGTNGTDGISINWRGDFASDPSSPELNDAYHNTTDGNAYIYDVSNTWKILINGVGGTPPSISNLQISAGFSKAVVTWKTDRPSSSVLEYGHITYDSNITSDDFIYEHSVTINDLTVQDYNIKVHAKDVSGNEANMTDSFTMQASIRLGGSGSDIGHAVVLSKDGNLLIAGTTNSLDGNTVGNGTVSKGGDDFWVIKTDMQGSLIWSKRFGGLATDKAYDLLELGDGTIAVVGETNSSSGDVTNSKAAKDGWILLLSPEGTLIWQRDVGSSGSDEFVRISKHPEGGLFVGGMAEGSDKDLSVAPTHLDSMDAWLFRIDASGSIIRDFIKDAPFFLTYGTSEDDLLAATRATWDGYYLCGRNSGTKDGDIDIPSIGGTGATDIWVSAFDNEQNMLWVKTFGGDGNDTGVDVLKSPLYTPTPIYYVAGTVMATGRDIINYHGGKDLWIGALDKDGNNNAIWSGSYTIGGSGDDVSVKLLWLKDNNLLVMGKTNSSDGNLTSPGNQGERDAWALKIDGSNGDIIWNKTFGGTSADGFNGAVELDDGSIVFVGNTASPSSGDLPAALGSDDLWIFKVDANGTRIPAP